VTQIARRGGNTRRRHWPAAAGRPAPTRPAISALRVRSPARTPGGTRPPDIPPTPCGECRAPYPRAPRCPDLSAAVRIRRSLPKDRRRPGARQGGSESKRTRPTRSHRSPAACDRRVGFPSDVLRGGQPQPPAARSCAPAFSGPPPLFIPGRFCCHRYTGWARASTRKRASGGGGHVQRESRGPRSAARAKAARPGSVLPSMNSRKAPPAVET